MASEALKLAEKVLWREISEAEVRAAEAKQRLLDEERTIARLHRELEKLQKLGAELQAESGRAAGGTSTSTGPTATPFQPPSSQQQPSSSKRRHEAAAAPSVKSPGLGSMQHHAGASRSVSDDELQAQAEQHLAQLRQHPESDFDVLKAAYEFRQSIPDDSALKKQPLYKQLHNLVKGRWARAHQRRTHRTKDSKTAVDTQLADTRGVHGANDPLVQVNDSIYGFGKGVFVNQLIRKGTVLTLYDGEYRYDGPGDFDELHENKDPRTDYCATFDIGEGKLGYVIGLCQPEAGRGLGSFVNDYRGTKSNANCYIQQVNNKLYVVACTDISKDSELLTDYGEMWWEVTRKNRQIEKEQQKKKQRQI